MIVAMPNVAGRQAGGLVATQFTEKLIMQQSDKKYDSPTPDDLPQTRRPSRAEEPRRRADDWRDDENDTPPAPDVIVSDRGPDSDGDNDDEINHDVTSPNNPGAGNDRVSNDRMPPRPRG
jgi:hypothetical protein